MAVAGSGGWIPSTEMQGMTHIGITQNAPRELVYSCFADDAYAGDLTAAYLMLCAGYRVRVDARYPNRQNLLTLAQTQPNPILVALLRAGVPMKDIRPFLR